jgi:hypothetical protein
MAYAPYRLNLIKGRFAGSIALIWHYDFSFK